jgi:hypothetical protein
MLRPLALLQSKLYALRIFYFAMTLLQHCYRACFLTLPTIATKPTVDDIPSDVKALLQSKPLQ